MTDSEIITYLLGVERAVQPGGIVGFLSMSRARQSLLMDEAELSAREALGHDSWAYWVRRGWDHARGADVPQR
jgi:hypothetical protein